MSQTENFILDKTKQLYNFNRRMFIIILRGRNADYNYRDQWDEAGLASII